jgi:hypothetical protein
MVKNSEKKPHPPMDYDTAIAFAHGAFERLHPLDTLPARFWHYATAAAIRDLDKNFFVVDFAWKKITARDTERFFQVRVNAWNAETVVLLDTSLEGYRQDELEEYL